MRLNHYWSRKINSVKKCPSARACFLLFEDHYLENNTTRDLGLLRHLSGVSASAEDSLRAQ